MTRTVIVAMVVSAVTMLSWANRMMANDVTVLTDADAGVRVICRNDEGEDPCFTPRGAANGYEGDWSLDPGYIRTHNQNALDVGYWHFDLSDIDPASEVTEAKFQVDAQSNSWGDTTVAVVAIADPGADWDLEALPEDEIIGENAPQADWEPFAWTGDDLNDGQQRYNQPLPFLDEGTGPGAVVRILEEGIFVYSTDIETDGTPTDPGNSYGGYACCDVAPGGGGSSDEGTNIWPIEDAVDIDVTELVKWKLGQNPNYSTFAPTDRELTLMVRTDFSGGNGFIRFISKESQFLGGELDLQPGRIVLSGNIIEGPGAAVLWAGDADRDLDFDQLDLVQVQVAAKYLTGQPATWGEGDWNGAPGGTQDSPPAGNGLFDTLDIVAALAPGHYLTGPYAALSPNGEGGDDQTSIIYNAITGEVAVDAPAGVELTSVNIDSAASIFTGEAAQNLGGSFDNDSDDNIFKATFGSSFGSISFGNVAQAGLSAEFVQGDLTVVGSLAGGGDLGAVDLIYVPEPSAMLILGLGLAGVMLARRRRRP